MQRERQQKVPNELKWFVGVWLGLMPLTLQAAFVAPTTWSRGQANSTYQEWDWFTSPAGPNPPDVGLFNSNGTPDLIDLSGGSFVTGGGNLYSPSAPLSIQAVAPDFAAAGQVTTVILQTRTNGTEIDYGTVRVNGAAPIDRAELLRQPLGGFGGYALDQWFKFELPQSAAALTVTFQAAGIHASLDRLAVDSITFADFAPEPNPVPEPEALWGVLVAGAFLARRRGLAEGR